MYFTKSIEKDPAWLFPKDYPYSKVTQEQVGEYTFYRAVDSDSVGYQYFPAAQQSFNAQNIELRTDRLEDGFRVRNH